MNDESNTPPAKKTGALQSLGLKLLVLIVLALMMGMCTFKYIS